MSLWPIRNTVDQQQAWRWLAPVIAAVVGVGSVMTAAPAVGAPPAGSGGGSTSHKNPDVTSPVASAAAAARAAAMRPAEPAAPPVTAKAEDPVTKARQRAATTGKPVEVAEQTSETSVLYVQPDGSLIRQLSAGPVRVRQGGAWVPIDTDLVADQASGVLRPVAVVGERSISGGGKGPLATLGRDGVSLSFGWPTALPEPEVSGSSATYRDVLDGVDLVVTVTSVGFSERLVVNEPLADPGQLESLALSVDSRGATVATGPQGSLVVTDTVGDGKGRVVAAAGAPVMWDARGRATDGSGADSRPVGARLSPGRGGASSLVLKPDLAFLADPSTVYPVTIDPAPSLTGTGDSFIRNTTPDDTQMGSTVLPVGNPDPAEINRALLRFDVSPFAGYNIKGATFELWNSYSATCAPKPISLNRVDDFDPATVTWNTAPSVQSAVGKSSTSLGHDASCPAGPLYFDLKSTVIDAVNSKAPLALSITADESDTGAYKVFNSGTAEAHVPTLTVTYVSACDQIDGYWVCDEVRDAWNAAGGLSGLGAPIGDTNAISPRSGLYQWFTNGSIWWSPATGAHTIAGNIRDKWAALNYESSWLGFPTGDQVTVDGGSGAYQEFEHGSIYWSQANGSHALRADFVDHYRSIGAQAGYLGHPTSDSYDNGAGTYAWFRGGLIAWDQQSNTFRHFGSVMDLAGQSGWVTNLDYQLSDTVAAKVNAGTGNLNLSISGLTVPGIGQDRTVGLAYNSFAADEGSSAGNSQLVGNSFRLTEVPDVRLLPYGDDAVVYSDPSGRTALYRWSGSQYESPPGDGGTKLERDGSNNWVLTTLASNRKQTFRSSDGLQIADADRNGNTYTYSYDDNGVPTSITGTRGGASITFTLGSDGRLGSMQQTVDGVARSVTLGYDAPGGRLTSVTDASGKVTTFAWTAGVVTSITDPRGITTAIQYDSTQRVVQLVRDYGGQNLITGLRWDVENRNGIKVAVTRVSDPNSNVTNYSVDAFGKVLDATDPLGHKKATTYSPNNDVATAVDAMPAANTTTYSYNGADGGFTPTSATAPTGASSSASYPTSGNGPQRYQPSSTTDTQGNSTTISYDAAGNPTQQISGGVTTSTTYNPPAPAPAICGGKPGQTCTETDGRGGTTTFSYDADGNLTKVTPPPGVIKATSYTYDGVGRPKTTTDGNGRTTAYAYDKNDRVTHVRYNGATACTTATDCEVYSYDADGNLTKRIDGAGSTTYAYNTSNRLSAQTTAAASGGGAKASTLTYDLAGNLVAYGDAAGTTRYAYDAGNNLVSLAEPGGSCTGTVSKCTRYTYDGNDVRTKITYPGGTTVNYLNVDAAGRPLQYKATTSSGSVLMDFTYSFSGGNGDGSLVQTRSERTVAGTAVQTYTYDGLNRLTRALEKVGSNTTASWTYCYDANGNRTYDSTSTAATVPCPGQPGGPAASYSYDATDALTGRSGQAATAFAYDGNGAELATVGSKVRTAGTWNIQNQLTGLTVAGTAHTFAYTGEGNKERTAFDGSGYQNTALGITAQTGTGASTLVREPNGTAVALVVGGVSNYFIADRQGSTISLVSATGVQRNKYSYDPYGVSRAKTETVTNPWQYIGGQLDASTGLYHLQARYYDPTIGRFTQPDPSGQEANSYAYASGDPVNMSDPSGELAFLAPLVGGVISGVTRHGLTKIVSRGVSPAKILDAVRKPIRALTNLEKGTSRYEGRSATVVVNQRGCIVTCFPKRRSGETF